MLQAMALNIGLLVLLVALSPLHVVVAEIPAGYILKVTPTCNTESQSASIDIITDLEAEASADCSGSKTRIDFDSTDSVNFALPVSYPPSTTESCVFYKKAGGSKVYHVTVYVSWGEADSLIHTNEEEFQVTCTFDENAKHVNSLLKTIGEGLIAAKAIQSHEGSRSAFSISMVVADVLDDTITDIVIPIGRKIKLLASSSDITKGNFLRAVGCDAVGTADDTRYAVIRAGCGDGVVFDKTDGFMSESSSAHSPYFEAFGLYNNPVVYFECNFTVCASFSCAGSSCTNTYRHRRDAADGFVYLTSQPIRLQDFPSSFSVSHKTGEPKTTSHQKDDDFTSQRGFWTAVGVVCFLGLSSIVISLCVIISTKTNAEKCEHDCNL